MEIIEEITSQVAAQKWEQPFQQMMDEIYWSGYAEKLAAENPTAYQTEYFYFLAMYL